MLKMRVIPCLDVKDGRVVKGVNFVDLTDAGDPVEQARLYDREGADELCFLDITASHEGRDTLYDLVEGIRDGHATAVLPASIFHFGTFRIGEAKAHLAACGVPVRP